MKSIGFGITLATLLFAGGLRAQEFMFQATPAPPAPPAKKASTRAAPTPPAPPAEPFAAQYSLINMGSGSYLGVGVADISSENLKTLKLKEERGVAIVNVEADSPAVNAGLKKDDVVLEYNGQRIEGKEQFSRMVRETPEGRQVRLLISRDGNTQTLTATIGVRKGFAAFGMSRADDERMKAQMDKSLAAVEKAQEKLRKLRVEIPIIDTPQMIMGSRSALGIEAEPTGEQLAEFFGVKSGVLVRSVVKDSAAAKAGLKAGDVITKIDETSVAQPQEISRALRALRAKKTFPVTVVRNRKEMTLSVTLEDSRSEIQPMALPAFSGWTGTGTRL